ncbi:MAG TPA: SDR family oxidoreductase [Aeromicrobium sp.]|nr:SDR family oxidoreductase [Aeromicrobium sp.]
MRTFADKVVVITGAGSGMGRSYAVEFARRGAAVALNDYDADTLAETVTLLPPGTKSFTAAFDVSDRNAVRRFADEVKAALGPAHVVINNAGISGANKPVWATGQDDYERVMAVNFYGVLHGTRAFLPHLRENGEGAVVNVSSIFGLTGTPNSSDYCAAKAAVRGFTESLMVELVNESISVHLVHPGGIATNIAGEGGQEFADRFLRTSPDAIAKKVADGIIENRPRIVYGYKARTTQLGANFLPRRVINTLLWRQISGVIDRTDYPRS